MISNYFQAKTRGFFSALLVFLSYLFFFINAYPEVVFGDKSFFRRDILRFYYPIWHHAVESVKAGQIPFWDPFHYAGAPFFANVQTCVFYPLTLWMYLPDFTWGFNFYILFHLAMAGFFTFLWMRECGASKTASWAAGLAFSAGGYMTSAINLAISLCSAAYFPLALLCFCRAVKNKGFFWKAMTSFALLLQYLAGDPSILFATVFVLALFCVYKAVENIWNRTRISFGPVLGLIQIILIFLGLSAFQMLLFGEFLFYSNRPGLDTGERMLWSMQINDLLAIVIPFFSDISMHLMNYWSRQSWLENYYCGVTAFCLGVTALFLGWRKNIVGYHALILFTGLAMAFGQFSLIYVFLHRFLPGLGLVRYPVRFFFLFSFGLACLAGFGLDFVLKKAQAPFLEKKVRWWPAALVLGFSLGVFLLVFFLKPFGRGILVWLQDTMRPFLGSPDKTEILLDSAAAAIMNIRRSLILAALIFSAMAAGWYLKPRRSILTLFFLVLIGVDFWASNPTEPSIPSKAIERPSTNIRRLLEDKSLFRFMPSPKAVYLQIWGTGSPHQELQEDQKELLIPNYVMLFGLQDLIGYNSLFLKPTAELEKKLMTDIWPKQRPLMDWLNVKYVISPRDELGEGFELIQSTPFANIFSNPNVFPRAFLTQSLERFPEKPSSDVSITRYSPHEIKMETLVSDKPWLFFSDTYYPGWKVWVDGSPEKIHKGLGAFRAVLLAPGRHSLVWKYDPPLFRLGLVISLLTAAGLLIGWLLYLRKSCFRMMIHDKKSP